MAEKFHIEGLKELDKALGELPKATGKNALKRALVQASALLVADWRGRVHVLTGRLQRSIVASTTLSRRQRRLSRQLSTVELYVGAGPFVEAITEEFGTAHNAAHPSGRPAWEAQQMNVLASIKNSLAKEIEQARARLARKAERLAAKINSGA